MIESKHTLIKSFGFAFDGIKVAIQKGRNFNIQTVLGTVAIVLGVVLKIKTTEWILLFLTISLVLILELINTAIEAIVDLISPEIRDKAKIAKDVSAAAVLIASLTALAVGFFLFIPKIFSGI